MDRFEKIASKVAGLYNWYCEMWMPEGATYCQGYFTTMYKLIGDDYLSDVVINLRKYESVLKNVLGKTGFNHGNVDPRVTFENGYAKLSVIVVFSLRGGNENDVLFQELVTKLTVSGIGVDVKKTSTKPLGM